MLLSSKYFSTYKMMDDFVDQDWFEESDEIVKQQGDQSPSTNVQAENGCQGGQAQQHMEFLELNVPVDENVFYTSAEISLEQQLFQQYAEQQQRHDETKRPVVEQSAQEVYVVTSNENQYLATTVSTSAVIPPKATHGENGTKRHQHLSGGDKCHYPDCPPTTSFSAMQSCTINQQQKQSDQQWTTLQTRRPYQQQLSHPKQLVEGSLHNEMPASRIIVRDQSLVQMQPSIVQQQFGVQTTELHGTLLDYPSSSNGINMVQQHEQRFIVNQQPLNVDAFSIEQGPSREQYLPLDRFHPFPQEPQHAFGSAKSVARKASKNPRNRRTSAAANSSLSQPTQSRAESGLDQIAMQLFSNANSTTIQFNPEQAVEFAGIMGQCQRLTELEKSGVDVSAELREFEARVADYLKRNALPITQSDQQQQRIVNGSAKSSLNKSMPARNRGAKKKGPPKTGLLQDQSEIGQISSPQGPASNISSNINFPRMVAPPQNFAAIPSKMESQAHLVLNACQPPPATLVMHPQNNNNLVPTDQSKPMFINASPLSTTSSFGQPDQFSLQRIDSTTRQKSSAVQATINAKRQERRDAQLKKEQEEATTLAAAKKARECENRRIRLTEKFETMRTSIPHLDCKTSFLDKKNCVERLLPFAFYAEPELGQDFLGKFDGELQRHSEAMRQRFASLGDRFRSVLFREAMSNAKEEQNLLLHLDCEFEKNRLNSETRANGGACLIPGRSNQSVELDWGYSEWDPTRYTNISPFAPSPEWKMGEEDVSESMEEITNPVELTRPMQYFTTTHTIIENKFASVSVQLHPHVNPLHITTTNPENVDARKKMLTIKPMLCEKNRSNSLAVSKQNRSASTESTIVHTTGELLKAPPEIDQLSSIREQTHPTNASPYFMTPVTAAGMNEEFKGASINEKTSPLKLRIVPLLTMPHNVAEAEEAPKAVKLKLKLGKRSEKVVPEKKDKQLAKLEKIEKKRLKAEKKARKKLERAQRKACESQEASTSIGSQNGEDQPSKLKICLRKLPCWKKEMCENTEGDGAKQLSNGGITIEQQPAANEESSSGGLKLRIPKMILKNANPSSQKDVATITTQNGMKSKRKRSRKNGESRSSKNNDTSATGNPSEFIASKVDLPKVPRLKIRIGNGENRTKSVDGGDKQGERRIAVDVPQYLPKLSNSSNQEKLDVPKDDDRIQFSPCCSGESEDEELRLRTNELFTKLVREH